MRLKSSRDVAAYLMAAFDSPQATMSALPDVVVSAMPHAVSEEAMRCRASPTAPMRERAHHVDRPISRNASTRPYGIFSSAPIRWANVPTKAEATPAAIVPIPLDDFPADAIRW